MPKTLICAELEEGGLSGSSLELISAAVKGTPGSQRCVALVGDDLSGVEPAVAALPVDKVFLVSHPQLEDGDAGVFDAPVDALESLCGQEGPEVVLFAKTDYGCNVGPRLASRLGTGAAQDCVDLAVNPQTGRLSVTRPVYGGNAMAVYEFAAGTTQVAVVRPGSFDGASISGGTPEVARFDPGGAVSARRARLIETVAAASEGVPLQDADVVISGGRGLGGPEPFVQLAELAGLLGGSVGATRAACDAGWIEHDRQVGLTGKTVTPSLYLAIGISGASQHMAGCTGSRNIVAINSDAEANIFRDARYGVVADWRQALPAFIATVQDLLAR